MPSLYQHHPHLWSAVSGPASSSSLGCCLCISTILTTQELVREELSCLTLDPVDQRLGESGFSMRVFATTLLPSTSTFTSIVQFYNAKHVILGKVTDLSEIKPQIFVLQQTKCMLGQHKLRALTGMRVQNSYESERALGTSGGKGGSWDEGSWQVGDNQNPLYKCMGLSNRENQ